MRVLLIEDDSAVARSIELMLKSAGFNIYTTDLGEEGVDLGKVYEYDMIILDLSLPDISGYEVLKQLRMGRVNTPVMNASGPSPRIPGISICMSFQRARTTAPTTTKSGPTMRAQNWVVAVLDSVIRSSSQWSENV